MKIKTLTSSIESIIKNVPKLKERLERLKNENVQLQDPIIIGGLTHQLEKLEHQIGEFKETKQEEDILAPIKSVIQDLKNRKKTAHRFSALDNMFISLYEANNKLSNLIKNPSYKYVPDNVKNQLDTQLKKVIKHDVLCVLLDYLQQHQKIQETIEIEVLSKLAQPEITKIEQAISNTSTSEENDYSIWKETLKKCLSNLSDNKKTINIRNTIDIIQEKIKEFSTEENIDIIQDVFIDIQNKVETYFFEKKTRFLKDIERLSEEIQTGLNGLEAIQKSYPMAQRVKEATLLAQEVCRNLNKIKNIPESHSFASQLEKAFTLFFEKKEWDKLGRGYLFFNKITPDGIVKIRNILKNDTFDIVVHEEKIFAICQIIKLKAHNSKSFSRRNDVHTQYQKLDNFLRKTYPHLYHLNRLPEESQLNTHLYNEENTRELLEYLAHTIPGQSSLPRPSSSP